MLATFLAMFVSGLWHGAAWTFIFWGSLHGIALVINHLWHKHTKYKMPKILAWVITFNFINISLVIFKASTISQAFDLLKNMFFGDIVLYHSLENSLAFLVPYGVSFSKVFEHIGGKSQTFAYLIIAFIIVLFLKNSNQIIENFKPSKLTLMYTFTIFVTAISMLTNFSEFLYFNF
jgi:hypothetical protein